MSIKTFGYNGQSYDIEDKNVTPLKSEVSGLNNSLEAITTEIETNADNIKKINETLLGEGKIVDNILGSLDQMKTVLGDNNIDVESWPVPGTLDKLALAEAELAILKQTFKKFGYDIDTKRGLLDLSKFAEKPNRFLATDDKGNVAPTDIDVSNFVTTCTYIIDDDNKLNDWLINKFGNDYTYVFIKKGNYIVEDSANIKSLDAIGTKVIAGEYPTINYNGNKTLFNIEEDSVPIFINNTIVKTGVAAAFNNCKNIYNCIATSNDITFNNCKNIYNCEGISVNEGSCFNNCIGLYNCSGTFTSCEELFNCQETTNTVNNISEINSSKIVLKEGEATTTINCDGVSIAKNEKNVSYDINGANKITDELMNAIIEKATAFQPGDKFEAGPGNNQHAQYTGLLTSSGKSIQFSIPVTKSLKNITTININGLKTNIRHVVGGYIPTGSSYEAGGYNWFPLASGYSMNAYKGDDHTIIINIGLPSTFSGVPNSTPLTVASHYISIQFA